MKRVGGAEGLLAEQPVNPHLALFDRTIGSPGQDLIDLQRKPKTRTRIRIRSLDNTRIRIRAMARTRTRTKIRFRIRIRTRIRIRNRIRIRTRMRFRIKIRFRTRKRIRFRVKVRMSDEAQHQDVILNPVPLLRLLLGVASDVTVGAGPNSPQ